MRYGYIGSMRVEPGHRDEVVAILTAGTEGLPMLTGEFTGHHLTVVGGLLGA